MLAMRLHHLAFRTRDVAKLERFYVEALGLEVRARRGEDRVWLDAAGVVVMIERAEADEPAVPVGTLDLVAFGVTAGEMAAHEARLARAGVTVEARTAHTIYARDPDGRRVGLSDYPFDGADAS